MWGSPPEPPNITSANLQAQFEQLKERVTSTETALRRHIAAADSTISVLNARIDALTGGKGPTAAADRVTTLSLGETSNIDPPANSEPRDKPIMTSTALGLPQGEARDQMYPMKQSTWDSLILVFLPGNDVSRIDSTVATVLFVANVIIQVVFTVIIILQATNLKNDLSGEKFHSDALAWRVGIGHHVNNYDPVTNTSLVTRVCTDYGAEVISKAQMDVYKAIDDYLGRKGGFSVGAGHGPLLSFLAVLIWTAGIGAELRQIWQFLSAVFGIKQGTTTACVPKINAMGERSYSIQSLSTTRRAVVVLAMLMRFGIAAGLWYAGMLWLTYTVEMNEIILNAVALGFVLEFDELFYHLVPREIDVVLQNVEPLPMSDRRARMERRWFTIFDPRSLLLVSLLFVTMFAWFFTLSREFRQQLQTSRHLFCSGDTNFVYLEDPATHVVNAAMTLPDDHFKSAFKLETSRPQLFNAVLQRTNLQSKAHEFKSLEHLFESLPSSEEKLFKKEIVSEVVALSAENIDASIDKVPCEDNDDTPATKSGMKSALGHDNCTEVVQTMGCTSWQVRTFCPVSCECDIVDSGIFKRSGCTAKCFRKYELSESEERAYAEREGTQCRDNPQAEEYGGAIYEFIDGLQQHLFDLGYLEHDDGDAVFTEMFKEAFKTRHSEMWLVEDIIGVNVTHWLYLELGRQSNLGIEGDCTWALYFDELFETNLCQSDLDERFGSLAPFCERTCGWCNSAKPQVETHLMASDLSLLLGYDVIVPLLHDALHIASDLDDQVCMRTGDANFHITSSTVGAIDLLAGIGLDRVFNFTARHTGRYTIRVTGQNGYDTVLSMWSGSSFQILHSNDDTFYLDPCFKVDFHGGEQIVLVVEGYNWNAEGTFQLTVECPWFDDGWESEGCPVNPGVVEGFEDDSSIYDLREAPCKSGGLHQVFGFDCLHAADELGLQYISTWYASYVPTGCTYDAFNRKLYIDGTGNDGIECGETFQCLCTAEEKNRTFNAYPTACDQASEGPCKVCVEEVDSYCENNVWDQMCSDLCNLICEPVCEAPAFGVTGPCEVTREVVEDSVEDWCLSSDNFDYDESRYSAEAECVFTLGLKKHEPKWYGPFFVEYFVTDYSGDILTVNGEAYAIDIGPSDVIPTGPITWTSDYTNSQLLELVTGQTSGFGWKICSYVHETLCVDSHYDGAVNANGQNCADLAKNTWLCDDGDDDDDFRIFEHCCHCGGGFWAGANATTWA